MSGTPSKHIRITSHPGGRGEPLAGTEIRWGAGSASERGPVIGSMTNRAHRNVIGTHSGSYGVYRALAVAAGALEKDHRADLSNTMPTDSVGPHPQWADPDRIVSIDPYGAMVADAFADHIACSSSTKSELVIPISRADGSLIGVFDIDSDQPDAFTQNDADRLTQILGAVFSPS